MEGILLTGMQIQWHTRGGETELTEGLRDMLG